MATHERRGVSGVGGHCLPRPPEIVLHCLFAGRIRTCWTPVRENVLSMNRRLFAAGMHLLGSAAVAACAAVLVFCLWYPAPFTSLTGGIGLFILLTGVDIVLGPALTAVIASPTKPRKEFLRDLALIVGIQIAALAYGLHTMALARPVLVAFEVDRFRLVTASEVDTSTLSQAPESLRNLPWTGPRLIAAVKPTDAAGQMRSIELGLSGIDLSMIPRNWRDFEEYAGEAWRKARPVSQLLSRYPQVQPQIAKIASEAGRSAAELRFLPVMSRQVSWVVVLSEPGARIQGVLPVDGFI